MCETNVHLMMAVVMPRATSTLAATAASLLLLGAASAQAFVGIVNTGPGASPSGFGHVSAGPAIGTLLASPFDPNNASLQPLLSPASPENDLATALADMRGAGNATAAAEARRRALDILEGNTGNPALANRAYEGIGLLNWKVKSKLVPAGGTVTIRQIRWGEHVMSDTWLLDFADPAAAYSIRYDVVELGSAFGGELDPTPLLDNGTTVHGGQHSAIQPLGVGANQDIGTTQSSRFTDARGLLAVPEQTRSAVQSITVAMPPANVTTAILDPSLRPGHEAVATLKPATTAQIDAANAAMGAKATAIGKLADESPEKQIWTQLSAMGELDPAADAPTAAAYLAAAQSAGTANAELVGAMRARSELPAGVDPGTADVTVVLQNNEAYVSRTKLRLEPGAFLHVRVVNRDEMTHDISAIDLHDRTRILGATDWGQFDWTGRDLAQGPSLAADTAQTFTLNLASRSFTLWVGDLGSGDQAGTAIAIDREIKQDAIGFGAGTLPVHAIPDAAGDMWVVLAGIDTIARVHPTADLASAPVDLYPLPGGHHAVDSTVAPLTPSDIVVDGHGIIWATLASGNALVRINPALVQPGTSAGMKVMQLDPCTGISPACKPEVPPIPNEQPTRRPTRLKSYIDGHGNTVLWFVEAGASRVGVMRVNETGTQLNQAHFGCACAFPESIDLAADGTIWFSEVFENKIGRVIPDPVAPFSSSAATVQHFNIPSSTAVQQPPLTTPVQTSLPLSLAVDGRGLVWFSQSSLSGIAFLDPAAATPGTSNGFTEFNSVTNRQLPDSDFRSPAAPADVMTDRANNVWWAGEYGDQIEQLHPDGGQGLRFRGSVRRGLTEGPVSDAQGNLWVVESGGNLLTRITNVTAGVLRPFGLPAAYGADTTSDAVTGARLGDDVTSVQVRVARQNAVVATATVPVTGGAFDVSGADWQGAGADQVRPDDTVRIQPVGSFARAPLSFDVAKLAGTVGPDGSIAGTALSGARALSDRVDVSSGAVSVSAPINGGNGAWSVPPTSLAQDTPLRLAWSSANVAGTFRTETRTGDVPPAPQPQPDPPAGTPAGGAAPAGDAAPGAGAPGAPATPAPAAKPAAQAAPSPCKSRTWLYGATTRPSVLLLNLTRAQLTACLGKPSAKRAARGRQPERWTYGAGLQLNLRAGRVHDYTLRDKRFATSGQKAGIGSSLAVLRRDLPGLRRDPRSGLQRALVRRSDGRYADIRVQTAKGGKISRIGVTLQTRSALDTFGRSLLRAKGAAS